MECLNTQKNPLIYEGDYIYLYNPDYKMVSVGIAESPLFMSVMDRYDYTGTRYYDNRIFTPISFRSTVYRLTEDEFLEYVMVNNV